MEAKKRKRVAKQKSKEKSQQLVDEEVSSEESVEKNKKKKMVEKEEEGGLGERETADEKRLRIAAQILEQIENAESSSDEEGVEDVVGYRIDKQQARHKILLFLRIFGEKCSQLVLHSL